MATHSSPEAVQHAIRSRLAELYDQCAEAQKEYSPPGSCGDAADRCANVESSIRLEELQARIAELEVMLQWPSAVAPPPRRRRKTNVVAEVGSEVSITFDGGRTSETFVLLPHELAIGDQEIVTPKSPLGRALQGAAPGDQISYRAANKTTITADILAVDGHPAAESASVENEAASAQPVYAESA
jgi:transcription elongation factor GreA